jgi:hypothetical protein
MKQKFMSLLWMRLILVGVIFITLCASLDSLTFAQPTVPQAFYGTVEIGGEPAPPGIMVEARGGGVRTGDEIDNPITITEAGEYGNPEEEKFLVVQGDLADGDEIEFYVNGVRAECQDPATGEWVDTYPFEVGGFTELNLRTEAAEPTPGPSPTPRPSPTPTQTWTPMPTASPADTPTPGPSPTPTNTPMPTDTPEPTDTPTPTGTPTPGPSPTPTDTPTPGPSPTPTDTPAPSPTPAPTDTAAPGAPTSTPRPTAEEPTAPPADETEPTVTDAPETSVPSPTPRSEEDDGGFPVLLLAAGLLALVGVAAVAFGILGLSRRT